MNNTRFFVVSALILGIIVAVGQLFYAFFNPAKDISGISLSSIQLLPASFDESALKGIQERASKYLTLTPEDFEDGKDVSVVAPIPENDP